MSLPTNPQSRSEEYLNAIATGDASNLPEPESRMDAYLDYIAKNGGGGGGTEVVANPTLAGTEADLTGLQVGDTKYKVPAGGGGGGALVVNVTETESGQDYVYTCDKTAQEILTALESGVVVFKYDYGYIETCIGGGHVLDAYQFARGGTSPGASPFTAFQLTDYPSYVD